MYDRGALPAATAAWRSTPRTGVVDDREPGWRRLVLTWGSSFSGNLIVAVICVGIVLACIALFVPYFLIRHLETETPACAWRCSWSTG